jgi:hypothetical protein
MPLVKASMKSDFRALFDTKPKDRSELADKWATAYDSYASLAITGNGGSVIAAGKKSALQGILMGVLSTPVGVPAAVAAAWGTGLLAYWGGTPFTPGAVPNPPFTLPGVAAPPLGISALIPALTALYSTSNSEDDFADQQATALDTCTKTVIVLFGAVPQPVQ